MRMKMNSLWLKQGPTISKNNGCRLQFGGPVLRDTEICVRLAFSNLHVKHTVFHNRTSCSLLLSESILRECVWNTLCYTQNWRMQVSFSTSIGLWNTRCFTRNWRMQVWQPFFGLMALPVLYLSTWVRLDNKTIIRLCRWGNKGLFVLLSRTQDGPGKTVKQEQEQISRNHVKTFSGCTVNGYRALEKGMYSTWFSG